MQRAVKLDKKKILVIDDEEDLCLLMKLNLESTGEFEVTTVFSGQEGIDKANEKLFDLVITDYKMPDMNGAEIIDTLKKLNPSLPVLLFSIYHDDASILPSNIKDKASGIIGKPIDHKELYKVINDTLDRNKRNS